MTVAHSGDRTWTEPSASSQWPAIHALPVPAAVLDAKGMVLAANAAWSAAADGDAPAPCAGSHDARARREIAVAVDDVVSGRRDVQSVDYRCAARWFVARVVRLPGDAQTLVWHEEATERVRRIGHGSHAGPSCIGCAVMRDGRVRPSAELARWLGSGDELLARAEWIARIGAESAIGAASIAEGGSLRRTCNARDADGILHTVEVLVTRMRGEELWLLSTLPRCAPLDTPFAAGASAKARALSEASDDVVLFLTEKGEIEEPNRRAIELLAIPTGVARRTRLDQLDVATDFRRGVADAFERARTARVPIRHLAFEPATRSQWDVRCIPLQPRKQPAEDAAEFLVVARDITELTELRRTATEGYSFSVMGALMAGVAHEVRNPLFAISATLDAFDLQHAADPGVADLASVLRREVDRLSRLMGDLLDYGRPTSMDATDVDLPEVIRAAAEECSVAARAGGVDVRTEFAGTLRPVHGDRKRLTQAFVNLIRNAIQHTRGGGGVEVSAFEVFERDTMWIDCVVADRGPGFAEGVLEHVFQPFFSRRRGGVGLGLALAQRIVTEHAGSVIAANRAGGGAIMIVRLPTSSASGALDDDRPARPPG